MAVDISSELQIIDNAVYGKDMRRAIRDALQKLANAINQGGGGSAGNKVIHVATHEEHLNLMTMGLDLDLDDVVLVDEDFTIMSHVTVDPENPNSYVMHNYYDPVSQTYKQYIGEIYGTLSIGGDPPEEENT